MRIAQALLGQQQQAASRQGFAHPARKVVPRHNAGHAQSPFIGGPAALVIPFDQIASGQAQLRVGEVRPESQRLLVMCRRLRRACPGSAAMLPRLLCASAKSGRRASACW